MAENVSETESVERTYGSGLHPEGAYSLMEERPGQKIILLRLKKIQPSILLSEML